MIEHLKNLEKAELKGLEIEKDDYKTKTIKQDNFTAILGDSCEELKKIKSGFVDLCVYSPLLWIYLYIQIVIETWEIVKAQMNFLLIILLL